MSGHTSIRRSGERFVPDRMRFAVGRWTEGVRIRGRARRTRPRLTRVLDKGSLEHAEIVLVSVMRNDGVRLPFWLRYYQDLGVDHFLVVDNGSADDTMRHLSALDSVTVYRTEASYKRSRYGIDWVNAVAHDSCRGKWVLFVDTDEFLTFDGAEDRSLKDLVRLLDTQELESLQCLLLDVYGPKQVRENFVAAGSDPFETCNLFDGSGYVRMFDSSTSTTWVKGGVRGRVFFEGDLQRSPALNKTPLVRWSRKSLFVQSAHRLMPGSLNHQSSAVDLTGVLLHQKFLASASTKVVDLAHIAQHDPEYRHYADFASAAPFREGLTRSYRSSADLVRSGLMSQIIWAQ